MISPSQGKSYYAQENSYSPQQSVANSQWMGKGAAKLGLNGQVKSADFENLLFGRLPDQTSFKQKDHLRRGYKERAGLDCTLSAPKSVSVLALVAAKKEIEKAHRQAVVETLKIIEKDYATTRVTKDGQVRRINTENLVVGQFHHDTSRELDPHLHTHCVILNLTEHDNKWYSFRNDDVFANRKLLGTIYRNQLALKVKKLGYGIKTKDDGLFEVKGFNQQQLLEVSKRRQQILSKLEEQSTWSERELVWDKTRSPKSQVIKRAELQNIWREQLKDIDYPKPGRNQESNPESNKDLNQVVDDAIAHCGSDAIAFKPEAVQKYVLTEVGKYSYQEVKQAIASSNELVYMDGQVTTQTALLGELATIKEMKRSQNKCEPIANEELTKSFTLGLREEQKQAIALLATSRDRIVAWQSRTEMIRTHALNEFKELVLDQGYTVKGFADSSETAQMLSEDLEIETSTVKSKLVSESQQPEKLQIWIVDEAGLLGAKTAQTLLQRAEKEDARVLLLADPEQLSFSDAGNPFKSLQQAGMATAHLSQSSVQKNADFKQAANLIAFGSAKSGIEILEKHQRLTELPKLEARVGRVTSDYLSLSHPDRQKTLIIADTRFERQLITDHIRKGLKQEGSLGREVEAKSLLSKNLTLVQKQYAHNYQAGDVVITSRDYKRLGVTKDQQYQVKAVEKDAVTLVDQDNIAKKVNPKWFKYKNVYRVESTQIAVGDKLRWGKNDLALNSVNNVPFVVTHIDGITATIETAKGKEEKINLEKAQHLDHALVDRVDSTQIAIAERVLVSLSNNPTAEDGYPKRLPSERTKRYTITGNASGLNIAASVAKHDLHLYVEDRASLLEKLNFGEVQADLIGLVTQHPAITQTFDHERNPSKPDLGINYSKFSQPNGETSGKFRVEPEKLIGLGEHISRFVDEQETQWLEGSFRKLERKLEDRIQPNSRTTKLGDTIKQLDRTLTEYSDRRKRVEQAQKLDKIKNSVEESILSNDPKLIEAVSKLKLALDSKPDPLNNLKQLQTTIKQYEKNQQQTKLKVRVVECVTSIADIQEEQELKALGQSFGRLNTRLQNYSADKSSRIVKIIEYLKNQVENQISAPDSRKLRLKQKKLNLTDPKLTPYQLKLRQNYLSAKLEVLRSNFSAKNDDFCFDVDIAKHLKSRSVSVKDINATLAQSDHVHKLLHQHRQNLDSKGKPNLDRYLNQVAKYICSVGFEAGLTVKNYIEKQQSPQIHKKPKQDLEL